MANNGGQGRPPRHGRGHNGKFGPIVFATVAHPNAMESLFSSVCMAGVDCRMVEK